MSTVKAKYLKDEQGNKFSPITSADNVFMPDGRTVSAILNKQANFYCGDSTEVINGGDVPFDTQMYNNTSDKITCNNGIITIIHTGFVKVSFNVWLQLKELNARPWAILQQKSTNVDVIQVIGDNPSEYYTSLVSAPRIFYNEGTKQYHLYININRGGVFNISAGAALDLWPTYITIELL